MTDGWTPPTEPGQPGTPHPGWAPPPGYGQPPPPGYGQPPQWGQPQWGQPQWGAPKPGIVPLRPLGLGEILDGAFGIIREYPAVTLGLSAIVVTVANVLNFAVRVADFGGPLFGRENPNGFSPAAGLTLLVTSIGTLVLAGMLTSVAGDAVLGRRTTIGDTWRKVRPRFWALVGAGILGALVPALGLVACIIPGVFLWVAWSFLTPVVVLERVGVGQSIRRSWRLAVPDWWRVFGIRLLAFVIAAVIQSILTIPATLIALGSTGLTNAAEHGFGVWQLAIITLGGIIGGTISTPFTSGVLALLYIDRRMRAEGLDVTLAQAAQAAQGPQAG